MTEKRTVFVHGANLAGKEVHKSKYKDEMTKRYLSEIRAKYDEWHKANMALLGPAAESKPNDQQIVTRRAEMFEDYKKFLDQKDYAESIDARSNLHSSALEEFMYYLFKDLVESFGKHALIGKSHTFKDLFFVPPSYAEMLRMPHGVIEKKDHDFVIGATVEATFRSSTPVENDPSPGDEFTLKVQEPVDYAAPARTENTETHVFDIPVVAIECKTYLDKTMLEGSSRAAEDLKARNPNGLYIVVMERIKLAEAVNLRKFKVDQIYVLRKQKNIDREYRLVEGYDYKPIDAAVVWHLFEYVRKQLTTDWEGRISMGIDQGFLL